MATEKVETAPASAVKPAAASKGAVEGAKKKKKKNKGGKKGKPGKYSQLVIDAIRTLGEKNGSSLVKIYKEAKKTAWFDQQNGRMYLRYSVRALLLNDTLIQVKGTGANGSFKLNKNKFDKAGKKKIAAKPTKTAKPVKTTKPAKKTTTKAATSKASSAKAKPKKKVAKKPAAAKKTTKKPAAKTAAKAKKTPAKKAASGRRTKK